MSEFPEMVRHSLNEFEGVRGTPFIDNFFLEQGDALGKLHCGSRLWDTSLEEYFQDNLFDIHRFN